MSFPRAQVKRFNEQAGCAPPPGHYNMPTLKPGVGTLPFDTGGQRFKQENSATTEDITLEVANQLSTTFLTPNQPLVNSSKKKLNFAAPGAVPAKSKSGSNKNTPLPSPSISGKEKQEFEKEIRRLIQQVNDQDKKLHSKTQDVVKLEGKLALLTKDKSSLIAQVAASEKKSASLEKSNTILQNQKVTEVEKKHKREGTEEELKKTKLKYETAKQELEKCRSLLVALQSDLETARSAISALQQSNHVLTQLNKEVQEHSDDVATQVAKLQGIADVLRTEKSETAEELTLTKEKLQDVKTEFTKLLQDKVSEIEKVFEEKQTKLKAQFDNAEKEIENLKKINENDNYKIKQLESEKETVEQEKNESLAKLKNLEDEHDRCLSQISCLQTSLTTSNDNCEETEKEKKLKEAKIEEFQKEIERLSTGHTHDMIALNEKLQALQDQYEKSLSFGEEREKELRQSRTENTELEEKIKLISENKMQAIEKLEKASNENSTIQEKIAILTSKLEEAQKEKQAMSLNVEENIESLSNLRKDNEALYRKYENSRSEVAEFKEQILLMEAKADALETQLMKANQNASRAIQNEESANQKTTKLEHVVKEREVQYQAKLGEFTRRLLETQKKLNQKQEELQFVIDTKEKDVIEMKNMRKSVEEQTEKLNSAEKLAKKNATLSDKVAKLENELSTITENEKSSEEKEKYKKLYEDLREKVKPFQVQIDAYSVEKSALLSENSAAHAEMQALGKKYAELLGHQNQKQKIRHVVKIKEENLDLKQEVTKLRTQLAKYQKQALENRPRKFNPNDAFQHKKENATPFGHNN